MRISDWSSDVCSSDLIIPGDSVETLARRVQFAEHQLYPPTLAACVTRERSPAYLRGRVRELAMALPEADEVVSHGMPCFGIVKGKKFAYFTEDHHGDGKIALLVKIKIGRAACRERVCQYV